MLKLKLNDVGEHRIMLSLGERSWEKVAGFPQQLKPKYKSMPVFSKDLISEALYVRSACCLLVFSKFLLNT